MASPATTTKNPQTYLHVLCDEKSSVGDKYRAIFELRSIGTEESVECLIKGFPSLHPSELLKHEVTYALGQMKPNEAMIKFLSERLQDEGEQIVVRHESGEALANFGREDLIELLSKYLNCGYQELEDTCSLAVVKLKNFAAQKQLYGLKFAGTIEPAAPFTQDEMEAQLKAADIKDDTNIFRRVEEYLLSSHIDIFNKYRAMYFLRETETKESIEILKNLLKAENRDKTRVLLRHEVCFIFGQLSEKAVGALDVLRQVIEDRIENEIVRHEAISGYSSMTDDAEILKKYAADESRIVKESCLVALDMIDYWKN